MGEVDYIPAMGPGSATRTWCAVDESRYVHPLIAWHVRGLMGSCESGKLSKGMILDLRPPRPSRQLPVREGDCALDILGNQIVNLPSERLHD